MSGRIFIIDDDDDAVLGLKQLLEQDGYEVATSASPLTAAFELRRFNPHLILLDLNMPGLGGERLLALDRKRAFPSGSQIVLYSGRGREELSAIAEKTGVDGYHSKGDDLAAFMLNIRRWVRYGRRDQNLMRSSSCFAEAAEDEYG